jgi:hypothetical protein
MSHFSTLVVGDDYDKQLAPYHEFECTGEDNEYVQDVDETEEARHSYEEATTTCIQDVDGKLHDRFTPEGDWNPEFFREPTPEEEEKYKLEKTLRHGNQDGIEWEMSDWKDGRGYRAKIKCLPEGWFETEVPTKAVETFSEYVKGHYGRETVPFGEQPDLAGVHKYGYALTDEGGNIVKVINRTNPERRWDWYKVGGRWNGYFKLKSGVRGIIGEPGLQTMDKNYRPPADDRADQCLKGDIDIDGMRDEAGEKAASRYDLFLKVTAGLPPSISWDAVREKHRTGSGENDIDYAASREEYNSQPMVEALRANEETIWFEVDEFLCTREAFVDRARRDALATFAVVKDSKWYERGSMGWWGCVSDEKDRDEWLKQFSDLIDSLPDNTLLTVVDCHI